MAVALKPAAITASTHDFLIAEYMVDPLNPGGRLVRKFLSSS
jgi:hypothetical protein